MRNVALEKRQLAWVERIPTVEVADSVVLNTDGSLAFGFHLQSLELVSTSEQQLEHFTQRLSELIRRLPDGTLLQLLVDCQIRSSTRVEAFIKARQGQASARTAAGILCGDVAQHAASLPFRDVRMFLFVCQPYHFQNALLIRNGVMPSLRPKWNEAAYQKALNQLLHTATMVRDHFCASSVTLTRAEDAALLELIQAHLNPSAHLPPLTASTSYDVPETGLPTCLNPYLTLREQLACSHAELPNKQGLQLGDTSVCTLTLKSLPDTTYSGMLAPLLTNLLFNHRITFTIEKLPPETARVALRIKRAMSKGAMLLSSTRNTDAETQYNEIVTLMTALSQSSLSLCGLQVSLAAYGDSEAQARQHVLKAQEVMAHCQGVGSYLEDYNHLAVYLSMLPGATHYFRRFRTVIDPNAAHIFVPMGAWQGAKKGPLLLHTRSLDPVIFNPFSKELPAYNGMCVAPTGSGKSFAMNMILANHLASGGQVVMMDIGGSYWRLTELFGGLYHDVGRENGVGLNPLVTPAELNGLEQIQREKKLEFYVNYLELLLSEKQSEGMPTSERAVLSKAITTYYHPHRSQERSQQPTSIAVIQKFLVDFGENEIEREICRKLVNRLDLWTHGPRARLFEKPIHVSVDAPIIAFDLKPVHDNEELLSIVIFILGSIIWSKLGERKQQVDTIVGADEMWKSLMNPAGMSLLEECNRTSRKYAAGLWAITQSIHDFNHSKVGRVLIENSYNKIFLRHEEGHDEVARVCSLNDTQLHALRSLKTVPGQYSEVLVKTGSHSEVLQIFPSPISYWMATSNQDDKDKEADYLKRHPHLSRIEILKKLARDYPQGAIHHD